MPQKAPADIDDYVSRFPKDVQRRLQQMRKAVRAAAPKATETISYRMPAFAMNGILVWFAAHTSHIGFYPRAHTLTVFKDELSSYKSGRGSVQFPFDRPLPLALVRRIVKFRVAEQAKAAKKS